MDVQAILKAAGIGAVVLIFLNIVGLIPFIGCLTPLLGILAYFGVGIFAVRFMIVPITTGGGAQNGAVAAAIAALIAGVINMIVQFIYISVVDYSPLEQIPQEQLNALTDAGIDPALLAGTGFIFGIGAVCCTLWALVAAGVGALGGYFQANQTSNG